MAVTDHCWVNYGIRLRKEMIQNRVFAVTKPIEEVESESGADMDPIDIRSVRFWSACRAAKPSFNTLSRKGVLIDFQPNEHGKIDMLTFMLDESWRGFLQRLIERNART